MVDMLVGQLEKLGKIRTNETNVFKRKTAAQVLVDSFMNKEMQYKKEEWNNVKINNIQINVRKDKKGNN